MPGTLFDTSVWLAAALPAHSFHDLALAGLREATQANPAVFCRATEQSFLRLLTTPALLKAYGAQGLTNRHAIAALKALQSSPYVRTRDEPPGTVTRWHTLAALDSASPKVWMDAYLAAFALAGGLRLMTLDRDFKQYASHGLQVDLLALT